MNRKLYDDLMPPAIALYEMEIRRAILKERQACARVAEEYLKGDSRLQVIGDHIAKAIRARSKPKSSNPPPDQF